jgi:F0F1-type ATP synthase assembly protein I
MRRSRFSRSQRQTIVHGILCIVVIIVILQLWLFTATINAYLGGDTAVLLPAALASLVGLLLNAGLLWYLYALER